MVKFTQLKTKIKSSKYAKVSNITMDQGYEQLKIKDQEVYYT